MSGELDFGCVLGRWAHDSIHARSRWGGIAIDYAARGIRAGQLPSSGGLQM